MVTRVIVRTTCDKCQTDIIDEAEHIQLKIIREDSRTAPLELDLHEGCVDPLYLPDEVVTRTRRPRRTRAQMEADAAAANISKVETA